VVGVLALGLGLILALHPHVPLGPLVVLMGCGMFVNAIAPVDPVRPALNRALTWIARTAWAIGGILVLAVPVTTIAGLALLVVLPMFVSGGIGIVQALIRRSDGWGTELLFGATWISLGIVALVWPGLSVFALATVSGVQLVALGLRLLGRATQLRRTAPQAPHMPDGRGPRTWLRPACAAMLCAAALGSLCAGATISESPGPDSFSDAPKKLPAEPGTLIRAEPFTTDIPSGATGWRILYSTKTARGSMSVASAIVASPDGAKDSPVIAWAHGTTGTAEGCAPSLLGHPFKRGAVPDIKRIVSRGWSLVAPDYTGLGAKGPHEYLVGTSEGRSVLDAIRAAQDLKRAHLGQKTVIWGHSQGGHAALWAGSLAPSYAPDLDIEGIAALSPVSDVPALLTGFTRTRKASVFGAYLVTSYATTYSDVDVGDSVRPRALLKLSETAKRCLRGRGAVASVAASTLTGGKLWKDDPVRGALLKRAEQNTPRGMVKAPLFIGQGEDDGLVPVQLQDRYVASRCAAGQSLAYRTYPGQRHTTLITRGSPLTHELLEWTSNRFDGKPFSSSCGG
jgi:pimeloyl-ACP methyl ester carboxylesterase/uncharacterized membrane protein HdeD (DUF308 family)